MDRGADAATLPGTEKGVTLGTPIGMFVRNQDMRPHDYGEMSQVRFRNSVAFNAGL